MCKFYEFIGIQGKAFDSLIEGLKLKEKGERKFLRIELFVK